MSLLAKIEDVLNKIGKVKKKENVIKKMGGTGDWSETYEFEVEPLEEPAKYKEFVDNIINSIPAELKPGNMHPNQEDPISTTLCYTEKTATVQSVTYRTKHVDDLKKFKEKEEHYSHDEHRLIMIKIYSKPGAIEAIRNYK